LKIQVNIVDKENSKLKCLIHKPFLTSLLSGEARNEGRKPNVRCQRRKKSDSQATENGKTYDLLEFINSLAGEGVDILRDQQTSRSEEAEWFGRRRASIEKGELFDIVAEVDGKVVANSEVERRSGVMSHGGYLGIGIRSGYRGIGIGTKIMKTLVDESGKMGQDIGSGRF
jgi:hypothetical protein